MVKSCAAYGCTSRCTPDSKLHFHKFPLKNPELNNSWVIAVKRENFKPTNNSYLCSKHFAENDYVHSSADLNPRLKFKAVPSIFDFPDHLKKLPPKTRKPPAKRDYPIEPIEIEHPEPNPPQELSPPAKKAKITISPTKTKLKKKIKTLQQKLRRKETKIQSLSDAIKTLQEKKLLTEDCGTIIERHFSGITKEIITSELKNNTKKSKGKRYSDEVKKFALTLHFYSPRAYEFLRSIFSLPAQSSISNWTNSVDCQPGFFKDVFQYLQEKSEIDKNYKDCALVFDAIHLKSGLVYEHSRGTYEGFVNFGQDIVGFDEDQIATEAMVFMLVGLRGNWKCPIGYVLENGLNATNLNTLTRSAIELSFQHGLVVQSVTCDGTSSNLDCMRKFGCQIGASADDLNGEFELDGHSMFFVPDACHMLKLARNALADVKQFKDQEGNTIKWKHIEALHKLQDEQGLKFANKLSKGHVLFHRHKMNVSIAAQTLSSSVADAIEFLMKTIKFIRIIDRLFDVLNTKNLFGKGFKKPFSPTNFDYLNSIITESVQYLSLLTDTSGLPLLNHRRKTFVIGLIINAKSTACLSHRLLNQTINPFKYVLTYKMSQDHLELLFACIRGKNGFNNNPDVRQFKSSLKRILLRNTIVGSKHSNCAAFETQSIGSVFSIKWSKRRSPIQPEIHDNDQDPLPLIQFESVHFSFYKESILGYIAGFIVRRMLTRISCVECANALTYSQSATDHDHFYTLLPSNMLISSKDRGGLVQPSSSVVRIVLASESCIKTVISNPSKLNKNMIINSVNGSIQNPFPELDLHDTDHEILSEDLHSTQLTKTIISYYIKIRLHSYEKQFNKDKLHKDKIGLRQQSTKLLN